MKMPEKNTMSFLIIKSIMIFSGVVLSYLLFDGAVYIVAIFMAILLLYCCYILNTLKFLNSTKV